MYKLRRSVRFLRLQLKRSAKLYIYVIGITLIAVMAVAAVAFALFSSQKEDVKFTEIKVGIVGDRNDKMLGMGIELIESLHEARFSVDFYRCYSEDAAIKKLKGRQLDAYVVVPENFSDSLMSGKNKKLKYVMAREGAGLSTEITREVMQVVSNYVLETQAGVTAACDYADLLDWSGAEIRDLDVKMSMEYVGLAMDRECFVAISENGLSNNLSFFGYYIAGLTLFLCMCIGIACCMLRSHNDWDLERVMVSRGISPLVQIACEYISFLLVCFTTVFMLFCVAGAASGFVDFGIPELSELMPFDYPILALRLLPALAVITAMQFLLYELTTGLIGTVLLQFLTTVVLSYVGGFFYPSNFFPDGVRQFSKYLPTGVAFSYFSGLLSKNSLPLHLVLCLGLTAVFLAMSVWIRRFRTRVTE